MSSRDSSLCGSANRSCCVIVLFGLKCLFLAYFSELPAVGVIWLKVSVLFAALIAFHGFLLFYEK